MWGGAPKGSFREWLAPTAPMASVFEALSTPPLAQLRETPCQLSCLAATQRCGQASWLVLFGYEPDKRRLKITNHRGSEEFFRSCFQEPSEPCRLPPS